MMGRREFITLLGGAAAAWPLGAQAQQPEQPKRVGVLGGSAESEFRSRFELFRDRLAQLGWMESQNLRIDYRASDNKPGLIQAYARELISVGPDVILADPGPAAQALQELTRTIPVVFITSTDPVDAGYVQSFAHPGGNMTGFTQFEASLNSKWLQLLKDVAPTVTRVAVLRFGGIARARRDLVTIEEVAGSFAVTPIDLLAKDDPADIARVINGFANLPNGGLIVPPSTVFQKHRGLVAALAERHRLPAIYNNRLFVDGGGLMSYGADPLESFRGAAGFRILRGVKPADLPVQAPSKYELVINLKTAKALGLMISREFLLNADEVIE